MLPGPRLHRYTYAEYVAFERHSDTKHEFYDGNIYALAGGTEEHSALAAAVLHALFAATTDQPCRPHTSDMRLYVESVGLTTYPDGSVICGPLEHHVPSPKDTALNPTVLVEVTSSSSEEYDTGFKLNAYRTIPSLRDYVIVSHRERRITVHHRDPSGEWTAHVAISGGRATVASINATLVVDEIYRRSELR